MKLIVITRPDFFEGEADAIGNLFRAGLQTLHLRKPGATTADVEHLLQRIDHTYHDRIVLHEHFDLVPRYGLKGIHLNARNPEPPQGYTARHISRSCHTLEEVVRHKAACTYVFLSPIFDSISKQGYASGFDHDTLQRAQREGIIDEHVVPWAASTRHACRRSRHWASAVPLCWATCGDGPTGLTSCPTSPACAVLPQANRLRYLP